MNKGKGRASSNEANDPRTPLLPYSGERNRPSRSETNKRIAYRVLALAAFAATVLFVFEAFRQRSEARQSRGTSDDLPMNFTLPGPQPGLRNPSYLKRGRHGAVATEVDLCSQTGVNILKRGGNAVDAAITSALCVGVTNMFSSGIGGGGFMVIRPADKLNATPISINFRESSPSGSHPNMFETTSSLTGGLSVGVPGEIRGLEAAYKLYGGGLSWKDLFGPVIEIAEAHPVGKELARRLRVPFFSDFMKELPEWRQVFLPDGDFLNAGDIIRQPALANTLRTIAEKGADAFYHGEIAKSMVSIVQSAGGLLTLDDLANYQATIEPAVRGTYRNRTIWTSTAPSSGPVLLSLLNTLEPIDNWVEEGRTGLNVHRFIEAQKFAFAHRTEFGDPSFMADSQKWHHIETKEFGRQTLAKIEDNTTHTLDYYGAKFDIKPDHGTTHLNVIDSEGCAVALTSTVNFIFGSRVRDPKTGILLNDEMNDFAVPNRPDIFGLRPSPFNYPEGPKARGGMGKRPMSSTSPSIIEHEDGGFWLAVGGSGGSRIFGAVAQVLLNLDWGYDLSHAIEQPRVHTQLLPAYVSIESGIQPEIVDALDSRGHNISMFDINVAACEIQAVQHSLDGWYWGASDSRKNGQAAAY